MEEKKAGLRDVMPDTAALVDDLRAMWGAERVNAAIATGVRLQREHARLVAIQGQHAADLWLKRQPTPMGCFRAVEGGRQVGVLKG